MKYPQDGGELPQLRAVVESMSRIPDVGVWEVGWTLRTFWNGRFDGDSAAGTALIDSAMPGFPKGKLLILFNESFLSKSACETLHATIEKAWKRAIKTERAADACRKLVAPRKERRALHGR